MDNRPLTMDPRTRLVDEPANPILEAIFRRRSIRRYTDQPVEPKKLELLLQAGMAAPSAMNCKPWEFIIVTDPEKMAQFRKQLTFGDRNAPAAIVVCGHPSLSSNPAARLFWVQDCSAAVENIMIAAVSLGLGTVWIGIHPVKPFIQTVREVVSIPRRATPLCLVYVGYPLEEKPARTQYDGERVFSEEYGIPYRHSG